MYIGKPKVSVIVPVHNAGKLLCKCLETLVNQTLREIEIIIVLDAPTDGSDEIAKEFAAKDARILLVENEQNLHVGDSRNKGLELARGEYIGFSDHDDFRKLNMYEELYSEAKKSNSDLVLSLPAYLSSGKTSVYEFKAKRNTELKEEVLSDLISFGGNNPQGAVFVLVTNNIYKADFLRSKNIRFVNTKLFTPEDVIFQVDAIYKSLNISLISQSYYFHLFHDRNESRNYSYIGYKRRGAGMNKLYEYLKNEKIFQVYEMEFYQGVVKQFIYSLSGTLFPIFNLGQFAEALKFLRSFPFTKTAFNRYTLPLGKKRIYNRLFRWFLVSLMKY